MAKYADTCESYETRMSVHEIKDIWHPRALPTTVFCPHKEEKKAHETELWRGQATGHTCPGVSDGCCETIHQDRINKTVQKQLLWWWPLFPLVSIYNIWPPLPLSCCRICTVREQTSDRVTITIWTRSHHPGERLNPTLAQDLNSWAEKLS